MTSPPSAWQNPGVYRARARPCPGCGQPMEVLPVDDPSGEGDPVEIDRCAACGGTFFDFFDGEPIALAAGTVRDAPPSASRLPLRAPTCPDCGIPMERRAYLGEGPELARCEGCLGLFVGAGELASLAQTQLAPPGEPPPDGWVAKLVAWAAAVTSQRGGPG